MRINYLEHSEYHRGLRGFYILDIFSRQDLSEEWKYKYNSQCHLVFHLGRRVTLRYYIYQIRKVKEEIICYFDYEVRFNI